MIFPKSLLAARRVGVATLLLPLVPALFGCSDEGSTDTESGALGQEESAVVGGSDTWDRPEVAQLQILGGFNGAEGGWCTATMISPIAFVTAAHCIDYATSGGNGALIHMRTGPNSNQARDTDVLSIYSLGNAPGTGDLAIGFLRVANPDGWDWTSGLHYGAFPSGLWTKIGYGCNSRSGGSPGIGGGVKRYREGSGSGTAWNCWGDSGGPLLAGGLFAFGGVAMVASGFNSNGTDNDAWVDPVWVEGMHRELSTPARGRGYEFGVDRPGFDYTSFSTSDAPPCRNACLADPHCQAFTVTFDSRGQTCFLKSAAASADPIPVDILSGVSEGYGSFDLPNGDLFVRDEPSVESCEGYCARTSTCRAFSYTNVGKCWIKDRANALRASTTVQSGTRRDLEVGIDRPGMDLRSGFASSSAAACSRSCVADKRCDAFSFTAGTCWLKAGIPGPVANAAATSGLRRGIEYNSRRNGAVYKDFDLGNEPMRRCQTGCAADSACVAWSAALPSGKLNGKRSCKLMSTAGNRSATAGQISGRAGTDFY